MLWQYQLILVLLTLSPMRKWNFCWKKREMWRIDFFLLTRMKIKKSGRWRKSQKHRGWLRANRAPLPWQPIEKKATSFIRSRVRRRIQWRWHTRSTDCGRLADRWNVLLCLHHHAITAVKVSNIGPTYVHHFHWKKMPKQLLNLISRWGWNGRWFIFLPDTSALTGSVADGRKDFVSVHYRAESVGLDVKRRTSRQ